MDGSIFLGVAGQQKLPAPKPAATAPLASLGFAALSSIPLATLLIGPQGLAFVNEAAETLLARQDGLQFCGAVGLTAMTRMESRQLQTLIDDVRAGSAGGLIPIPRSRAPLPLLVSVAPLRDQLFGGSAGRGGFALVLIHDPLAGCAAAGRKALIDLYALTEAEASVAVAIVSGRNAKRIASMRDVSLPTIRSQIRQILAKTGCRDQRELISRFGWLGSAV